jgi:hypothetical protein
MGQETLRVWANAATDMQCHGLHAAAEQTVTKLVGSPHPGPLPEGEGILVGSGHGAAEGASGERHGNGSEHGHDRYGQTDTRV